MLHIDANRDMVHKLMNLASPSRHDIGSILSVVVVTKTSMKSIGKKKKRENLIAWYLSRSTSFAVKYLVSL